MSNINDLLNCVKFSGNTKKNQRVDCSQIVAIYSALVIDEMKKLGLVDDDSGIDKLAIKYAKQCEKVVGDIGCFTIAHTVSPKLYENCVDYGIEIQDVYPQFNQRPKVHKVGYQYLYAAIMINVWKNLKII